MYSSNIRSQRIIRFDVVSLILSFMVIMIHSSYTYFFPTTDALDTLINDFYCDYISGFAVPGFFLLAGIKFFKNYDYGDTRRKIKSRVNTLLLPYIAWNTISVIWAIILSYTPGISSFVSVREKFSFSLTNFIGGILWFKYIHPFWFMALLIIFTVICPLIFTLIRNQYVGIIFIVGLFLLHVFGKFPKTAWPIFQIETIVYGLCFYMIGGVIGRFHYERFILKPSNRMAYIAIIEFIAAVIVRSLNVHALFIPSILLGLHAIWTLAGMINDSKSWWLKASFFVYPAHTFVLPVVNKLISFALPKISIMALFNTGLGTIVTFVICVYLAKMCESILPKRICAILNGGRRIIE